MARSNLCSPKRTRVEVNHNALDKHFACNLGESKMCWVLGRVIVTILYRLKLDHEAMGYASLKGEQTNQLFRIQRGDGGDGGDGPFTPDALQGCCPSRPRSTSHMVCLWWRTCICP
jgi:hypothetical protein